MTQGHSDAIPLASPTWLDTEQAGGTCTSCLEAFDHREEEILPAREVTTNVAGDNYSRHVMTMSIPAQPLPPGLYLLLRCGPLDWAPRVVCHHWYCRAGHSALLSPKLQAELLDMNWIRLSQALVLHACLPPPPPPVAHFGECDAFKKRGQAGGSRH